MHDQEKPGATLPGPTARVGYEYADVMVEAIVDQQQDPDRMR